MTISSILHQILNLSIALFPTSYFVIKQSNNIFNKNLYSLGTTTSICTNITGILSKKNPVVSILYFDDFQFQISTDPNPDKNLINSSESIRLISAITSYCHFPKHKALEESIQVFLKNFGIKAQEIKDEYRTLAEIKENEDKKLTSVVVIKKDTEDIFALSKGNVKTILDKCTRIIINNKKIDLTTEKKRAIKRKFEKLSKQGRKLIAYAYKGLPKKILDNYTEEFVENDLIFIGFIGLNDEINNHLKESIEKIRAANIKIYITTSLKEKKARHAALELKVVNTSYFETLNGATIADLDDKKLQRIISNREKDFIFCELTSQDKKRIIQQFENLGEKITVLNPNNGPMFSNILDSVKLLKEKEKTTQKIKTHSLNCKTAEFILILVAILLGNPSPLSITVIILIDVIVNIILELAIRESIEIEDRKTKTISSTGVVMGMLLTGIYIINLMRFGWQPGDNSSIGLEPFTKSATMVIASIIIFQIITAYLMVKKPFKNIYLTLSTIVCLLFLYIVTSIPSAQSTLGLGSLNTLEWQITIFTVVLLLAFEEIRKYINRHKKNADTKS